MILHDTLLVTLVKLVDRLPMPVQANKRERGHPRVYSDRVFLKALVIMIVRHLHKVNELLSMLAQPTAEMALLRDLLSENSRFPSRRTWERRLLVPPLAQQLFPLIAVTAGLAEFPLLLWLLVVGVNAERWKEQEGVAGASLRT